jgi:hypothetical protein
MCPMALLFQNIQHRYLHALNYTHAKMDCTAREKWGSYAQQDMWAIRDIKFSYLSDFDVRL